MSDADEQPARRDPRAADLDTYERLVESLSTHAIFELDADGYVRTWPVPAERLYGLDAARVRGQRLDMLIAADEDPDRPLATLLDEAATGSVTVGQWHERADGTVFWATLSLSPLWDDAGETVTGFTAVCQDTTDRKQRTQMLERQNDRLKEFTDILAHDLRTPLSVIDGRLALYDETGDPEHVAAIGETTARMERLVDDLLSIARQGDVVTDPEPVNLEVLIETVGAGIGPQSHDATVTYEPVGDVSADPDRLRELFENLFRNAVEHGGDDVAIRIGPVDGGFFVEDDGPGIPESMRESVFDHGVSTSDDGSGYGLSIVRTIAHAHGWDIVVTDAASGGARFEVTGIEPIG